jgi:hypothetical protein
MIFGFQGQCSIIKKKKLLTRAPLWCLRMTGATDTGGQNHYFTAPLDSSRHFFPPRATHVVERPLVRRYRPLFPFFSFSS